MPFPSLGLGKHWGRAVTAIDLTEDRISALPLHLASIPWERMRTSSPCTTPRASHTCCWELCAQGTRKITPSLSQTQLNLTNNWEPQCDERTKGKFTLCWAGPGHHSRSVHLRNHMGQKQGLDHGLAPLQGVGKGPYTLKQGSDHTKQT